MATLNLTIGERAALLYLLNTFDLGEQRPTRTASVMRKTKRIKHAIDWLSLPDNATDGVLLKAGNETIECKVDDKETLNWLWDLWQKFSNWPTQLDEWIDTLEDKLRAVIATAAEEKK